MGLDLAWFDCFPGIVLHMGSNGMLLPSPSFVRLALSTAAALVWTDGLWHTSVQWQMMVVTYCSDHAKCLVDGLSLMLGCLYDEVPLFGWEGKIRVGEEGIHLSAFLLILHYFMVADSAAAWTRERGQVLFNSSVAG